MTKINTPESALPHPVTHRRPLDWLGFAGLVLCWGGSFAGIKLAVADFGPYWLAAARLGIATALMIGFALIAGIRLPRGRREWAQLTAVGLLGTAAPFILIGWATQHVPSGIAGLMMAFNPILVLMASVILLPEEKVTPLRLTGFLLGFAGVSLVIIAREPIPLDALGGGLAPFIALLLGSAGYAANAIGGRLVRTIPPMTRVYGILIVATIATTIAAALIAPPPSTIGWSALFGVLYLGSFSTFLAYLILFWLVARTSAGFVAQSNYLVPATAIVLGAIMLGERLHPLQYVGFLVILGGVAIAENIFRRKKIVPPPPA
jgi:drug/metabolite transporter (DMT)-like permease